MAITKAIVVLQLKVAAVRDVLMPIVHDDWVPVKIKAVGINPTDWKHISHGAADAEWDAITPALWRRLEVKSLTLQKVIVSRAGFMAQIEPTMNREHGDAEYAIAKASVQRKIPDNLSFEEAATLGVAIMAVGQGMYKNLQLPLPTQPCKEAFPPLIYGGSTATGMAGIQLAKLSGLTVITTCSPRNFDLVKGLVADVVFDYKSPTCAAEIKQLTKNRLTHAWDCTGKGAAICAQAMSDCEPGTYRVTYTTEC